MEAMVTEMSERKIYLDNAATTIVDDDVIMSMTPHFFRHYGNPGSIHLMGKESRGAVGISRHCIANLIGCNDPDQIIFTSSGTEANNLCIRGIKKYLKDNDKMCVAMSTIEHDSVRHSFESLKDDCFNIVQIHTNEFGYIDANCLLSTLDKNPDISFVSIMHTNNETGMMNDVEQIGEICKKNGILFHCDCVQSAGCSEIDVEKLNCDFLSLSSHKIHGPKGVGALYVRDKSLLTPIIFGGSNQEYGLRGGTENVPGIAGFGYACYNAFSNIVDTQSHNKKMIKLMANKLTKEIDGAYINGNIDRCSKTFNIRFDGVDAETLVLLLDKNGVYVSAGSACRGLESEPSQVLKAIGLTDDEARSSIRISVSKYTTEEDAIEASDIIINCVNMLRSM